MYFFLFIQIFIKMELSKNCPCCGKEQKYSRIDLLKNAIKKNSLCNSCKQIGDRNHFFNKNHSDETKKHISKQNKNIGQRLSEFTLVDNPTMDEPTGNSLLKSSGWLKQEEKTKIYNFSQIFLNGLLIRFHRN